MGPTKAGLWFAFGATAALISWPGHVQANPVIDTGFFVPTGVYIALYHSDYSPEPELAVDFSVTQGPFSSFTSSGGGSGGAGFPVITVSANSAASSGGAYLTAVGAGSAMAAFGVGIEATFTNTGQTARDYSVFPGYYVDTFVDADPAKGEAMTYSWTIGFSSLTSNFIPDAFESQSHVCNQKNTYFYDCHNFYDFNEYPTLVTLEAGESVTVSEFMDFNFAVSAVSEPTSLMVLATCLVGLGAARRFRPNGQRSFGRPPDLVPLRSPATVAG